MGVGGKAIPPYIDKITDIRWASYLHTQTGRSSFLAEVRGEIGRPES